MKRNGSPPPEFDTDDDRSYFLVRLPIHERVIRAEAGDPRNHEAHDEAHDEAHGEALQVLSEAERRILELCAKAPKTASDLLAGLGYQSRTGNFKRALDRLLKLGWLEMTIPDKPRSRNQHYRLSAAGSRMLETKERP